MGVAKPCGGSTTDPATSSPGSSQTTSNVPATNSVEGPVGVAKSCGGPIAGPATSTQQPSQATQDVAASNEYITMEDPSGIPSHTTRTYTTIELTDTEFRRVWSQGAPLVVTGLGEKFGVRWRPEHFREKHGSQTCSIVECQTDASKRVTLGEFFGYFGKYEGRTDTWKLKDWPSSSDFKTALPDLFEEFQKGVPMPYYSRKDGVLNIASHFPSNTVMPDLGRWSRQPWSCLVDLSGHRPKDVYRFGDD
jgi:lysine-specific demethylase 3